MKILIGICIATGVIFAQNSTPNSTKDSTKTTAPKQTKRAPAVVNVIPKDAVETAPGFFRWTDKDGKAWMYRRTPFGLSKWPVNSPDIVQADLDKQNAARGRTTALAEGDSIRFEEVTPFGKHTWVRKKDQLTDTERMIWDSQHKDSTASRTSEKE